MNLHLVAHSAFQYQLSDRVFSLTQPNDHLVLVGNGCYNLQSADWLNLSKEAAVLVSFLGNDCKARGIFPDHRNMRCIDMDDLVKLSFSARHIFNWN